MICPERIQQARNRRGETQRDFAEALSFWLKENGVERGCEVTGQTISNWETGKTQPSSQLFEALRAVTDCTASYFYGESEWNTHSPTEAG